LTAVKGEGDARIVAMDDIEAVEVASGRAQDDDAPRLPPRAQARFPPARAHGRTTRVTVTK
jgi:hypothetical protein